MAEGPSHVIATAGHVDHGKSSLIFRLTGIDPDRWEEEKRRGLTIDLGFAWCSLPSGVEVGFVDVPGHERFVRNMLAGVGPVRLVLFVVAADEGWKPQSEEHLAIIDLLGAADGVVALTKADLVDPETVERRRQDVRARLARTALAEAPIVTCSATTGVGLEELRAELDAMIARTPEPRDPGRPRITIDRSFTIRGAGTVVTGTLTGGALSVGEEVEVYPASVRARIRSLQTHQRSIERVHSVARVAVNLAGVSRDEVARGDVLGKPGQWRPTRRLEVRILPIRGLDHPLTERGAFKFYSGTSERDARLRFYATRELRAGESTFARLTLAEPAVVQVGDRFVLREAGRRQTVGGGLILDTDPPSRPGSAAADRLAKRESVSHDGLARLLVEERGAVRAADLPALAGSPTPGNGSLRIGAWWVSGDALAALKAAVEETLSAYHAEHALREGMDLVTLRQHLLETERELRPALEQDLAGAVLDRLTDEGLIARDGNTVRLARHEIRLGDREDDAGRLIAAVRAGEPTPLDMDQLVADGYGRELIDACVATGRLVSLAEDILATPEFVSSAERIVRDLASRPEGLTVSQFRKAVATTRKYALPLLAYFDARGLTKRDGDLRRLA